MSAAVTELPEDSAAEGTETLPQRRRLAWLMVVTGAVGFFAAAMLVWERLQIYVDAGHVSSCDLNSLVNCGTVMRTSQAAAFGFPNPLIGIVAYVMRKVGIPLIPLLIAFVLALRMLPSGLWNRLGARVRHRAARVAISIGFGAFMMVLAAFALSSRITDPISLAMPQAAYEIGHGKNVVNVILVDMRAWDTFGETSVLALAATGVASLIFIAGRQDLSRARKRLDTQGLRTVTRRYAGRTDLSPGAQVANDFMDVQRDPFLVAGRTLAPENRSLMLEVVTRLIFHSILIVSLYLLLAGHNLPGGGFAGGLLAGLALALRYLAGGRYELSEASPVNAGVLLGSGLLISGAYALSPLLWGGDVFTSYAFDLHLPVFGEVHLVTALIFDIGVYLVVVGLILDVLRSLGGKIDENLEQEREASARRARGPRRIQVRRSSTVAATPSGPVTATPVDEDGEATADTAAVAGEGGRA